MLHPTCSSIVKRFFIRGSCGAALALLALGVSPSAVAQPCIPGTQLAHLYAPGALASDQFGKSVCVSGDTMIMGAPGRDLPGFSNAGSAYVFVRSGGGWLHQATLTPADPYLSGAFGAAVVMAGDTAVVGASGQNSMGAAYVFVRTGGTWTQQAKITPYDGGSLDLFGAALALQGDTLAVGAYSGGGYGAADGGAVYVYVRAAGVWTLQQKLVGSGVTAAERFGTSVALDGDSLAVGCPYDSVGASSDAGTAFVFVRAAGVWTEQAKVWGSVRTGGGHFGAAIALEGATMIVGADRNYTFGTTRGGQVFIFGRTDTAWSETQPPISSPFPSSLLSFGRALSLQDERVVIGAASTAFVFARTSGVWSQVRQITGADSTTSDQFGIAVALDGDFAACGAYLDDTGNGADAGSAYVFDAHDYNSTPLAITTPPQSQHVCLGQPAALSVGVSGAGPFTYQWRRGTTPIANGGNISGATSATLVFNSLSLADNAADYNVVVTNSCGSVTSASVALVPSPLITKQPQAASGLVGHSATFSVATESPASYQWRKDGIEIPGATDATLTIDPLAWADAGSYDVVVTDACQSLPSAAAVLTTQCVGTLLDAVIEPPGAYSPIYADGVALSGDTLLVSGTNGSAYCAARAFRRVNGMWQPEGALTPAAQLNYSQFGQSCALHGDTAVIGEPTTQQGSSCAHVFERSGSNWVESAILPCAPPVDAPATNVPVATDGDTVIVGVSGDASSTFGGFVKVFTRSAGSWVLEATLTAADQLAGDEFGASVALSGNTLVVGASRADIAGFSNAGAVYVFTRSGSTWTQRAKLVAAVPVALGHVGSAVAISGDTIVAGADGERACHVFVGAGSDWTLEQRLTPSGPDFAGLYGCAVAINDDTVVVGAGEASVGSVQRAGAIWIYARSGTQWSELSRLVAPNYSEFDYFGLTVVMDGETIAVGAPNYEDSVEAIQQGVAFVYGVNIAPSVKIVAAPADQAGCLGGAATFTVAAQGHSTLTYRWRRGTEDLVNDAHISGVDTATLTIDPVGAADVAGDYNVVVTDDCDSAASGLAALTAQLKGDANCDGAVNNFDIDAFLTALLQPAVWQQTYSCDYVCANDVNHDSAVNNFDIDAFVGCILNGCN